MEIKSIAIKNFKGVPHLHFVPSQLNFITGPSGSGKSSLMNAIRYGITGKSSGTHITAGEASSSVEMDINIVGILSRSAVRDKGSAVRLNRKATTAKSVGQMFEDVLGVSVTDMGLLTSSEALEHALGKDLAEYLLTGGFLKNEVTLTQLLDACPTLSLAAKSELERFFATTAARITLEDIDKAHTYYRDQRPAIKRFLTSEEALSRYSGDEPTMTAKKAQEMLDAIQAEIAVENKAAADYPKAKAQAKQLHEQIVNLEKQIAALPTKRVTARELQIAEDNRNNAKKLLDSTIASIELAERDITQLQQTIDTLGSNICPISKQLVCTTDKSKVREELEMTLSMKQDLVGVWEDNRDEQRAGLESAEAALAELQQQERNYTKRITLMNQLEELKKITVIVPTEPDSSKLASLTAKREAYRNELNQIRAYEAAQAHAATRDSYKEKLAVTEELVETLAPSGGIRKTLLERSIGPLEMWCNDKMKSVLPKYTLHFDANNNFEIFVNTSAGEKLLYEDLSTGEQLRVIYLIMGMINELNGARILLLDNVNALDVAAFKDFISLVESDIASYDHVFVSGVNHEGFADVIKSCSVSHQVIEV